MHFLYQACQLMCTLLNYCNITNKMRQCVSSVRIRSPLHKKVYKQCVCGLFASFSEITVRILLPLPIPQQHLQAPVIRLFPLPGEKAAGEFPACAVIGDAFAAFSMAGAGIGAGAGLRIGAFAHKLYLRSGQDGFFHHSTGRPHARERKRLLVIFGHFFARRDSGRTV